MSGPSISCIFLSTNYTVPYSFELHPDGNGAYDFFIPCDWSGPSAGLTNSECVDELIENGASDYVLLVGPSHAFNYQDLYDIESLPSTVLPTDIIKTVTVISYAEFCDISDDGMPNNIHYNNLLYVNGTQYNSTNLSIGYYNPVPFHTGPFGMNGWKGVSYTWSQNPDTLAPWDYSDLNFYIPLDLLQIGVETSVPTQYETLHIGMFSDLVGDVTQLTPSTGDNWSCVSNHDALYIYSKTNNSYKYDLYKHDNSHGHAGNPWNPLDAIISVRVNVDVKLDATGDNAANRYCKTVIKTHGTEYHGNKEIYGVTPIPHWVTFWTKYDSNPSTGLPWTATELDDLQLGVGLFQRTGAYYAQCNDVYLDIYYIHPESGEVAVTQCYMVVNAEHVMQSTCRLPSPAWDGIQVNQDIDTMGLNFWSGNREVYGLGRSSKRTILSGLMWDGCTNGTDTCEDIIACVRALAKKQKTVTITGLYYPTLNDDYNIISFSWTQIAEKPNHYEWTLELEFVNLT